MRTHDTWERTDFRVSVDKQEGLFLHGLAAEFRGLTNDSTTGILSNIVWALIDSFRETDSPAKRAELLARLGYTNEGH